MDKTLTTILVVVSFASPFIGLLAVVIFKIVSAVRKRRQQQEISGQEVNSSVLQVREPLPAKSTKQHAETSTTPAFLLSLGALFILLIGAWVTGVIVAIVGSFFYLVVLFPIAMGFAGGETVKAAVQTAKVRKSYQVVLMSLLVAAVMYGTYHQGRYVALQVRMSIATAPTFDEALSDHGLAMGKMLLNTVLKEETGHDGFFGYLLYKAQQGLSIGKFYSSNRLNLGFILTWAYWMLEFGIILWIAISAGKKEASVPVCEFCGTRIGREKHLGGTVSANESLLLDLIQRREFAEVGKLIEENAEVPSTELYMKRCEACEKGDSYVAIRRAFKSSGGALQFKDVQNVTLQPTDMLVLAQYLPNR